jgi:hypothetical protein
MGRSSLVLERRREWRRLTRGFGRWCEAVEGGGGGEGGRKRQFRRRLRARTWHPVEEGGVSDEGEEMRRGKAHPYGTRCERCGGRTVRTTDQLLPSWEKAGVEGKRTLNSVFPATPIAPLTVCNDQLRS